MILWLLTGASVLELINGAGLVFFDREYVRILAVSLFLRSVLLFTRGSIDPLDLSDS